MQTQLQCSKKNKNYDVIVIHHKLHNCTEPSCLPACYPCGTAQCYNNSVCNVPTAFSIQYVISNLTEPSYLHIDMLFTTGNCEQHVFAITELELTVPVALSRPSQQADKKNTHILQITAPGSMNMY